MRSATTSPKPVLALALGVAALFAIQCGGGGVTQLSNDDGIDWFPA